MAFDPNGPARESAGIFGLSTPREDAAVVLTPVPVDATVTYGGGTSRGPAAILEASAQVDLEDDQFGGFWTAGIVMEAEDPAFFTLSARYGALVARARAGDRDVCEEINAAGTEINRIVQNRVSATLAAGKIAGVVGGEHAVSFGAIRAAAATGALGVLHIDAHNDLRAAYEGFTWSHASVMHNVTRLIPAVERVVSVGVRDYCQEERDRARELGPRWVAMTDREVARRLCAGEPYTAIAREIVSALPDRVYITLDIDGLDPSLCPGTGTPVPGGLTFHQLCALLDELHRSKKTVVAFDLVEVAPGETEWDANVGARVLFKLCGAAIRSGANTQTAG